MKPEDSYRELIRRIHAPEDAKQNILNEASALRGEKKEPGSKAPERSAGHPGKHTRHKIIVRLVAAAAGVFLALTVVRGGIDSRSYDSQNDGGQSTETVSGQSTASIASGKNPESALADSSDNRVASVTNFFCLAAPYEVTVQAASLENRTSLALHSKDGDENFTGNEFYIRGQNIETVTIRLNRDGFYLASEHKTTDEHEVSAFLGKQNEQDAEHRYTVSYDQTDNSGSTVYTLREVRHSGQEVTLNASELASTAIGFYTPVSYTNSISTEDQKVYFHKCTDYVNGATMSVSITYTDGSEETQTYRLETGKLKVRYGENGQETVDEFIRSENEPWLYGVLITEEN